MVYPYEQAAIRGDEVPEGLNLADVWMFLALRNLYKAVRDGTIDREQGKLEKRKLENQFRVLVADIEFYKSHRDFWARIEQAGTAYCKDRNLDNADKFYECVYGIRPGTEDVEAGGNNA